MATDEFFEVYDERGNPTGLASRRECHGNPTLIHRTAHVVIMRRDGRLLLQKRKNNKDIQPGKWDTAVGGHVMLGEDYETAARREMREELGLPPELPLQHLFDAKMRNSVESEDIRIFSCHHDGPFEFQQEEIDAVKFWTKAELLDPKNRKHFTPNLLTELEMLFAKAIIK